MREVAAGKFKAECLALMDEVQTSREPLVVTKYGRPVVKLVPIEVENGVDPIFGFLKGKAWIISDPMEWVKPIVPEEDWSDTWEPAE